MALGPEELADYETVDTWGGKEWEVLPTHRQQSIRLQELHSTDDVVNAACAQFMDGGGPANHAFSAFVLELYDRPALLDRLLQHFPNTDLVRRLGVPRFLRGFYLAILERWKKVPWYALTKQEIDGLGAEASSKIWGHVQGMEVAFAPVDCQCQLGSYQNGRVFVVTQATLEWALRQEDVAATLVKFEGMRNLSDLRAHAIALLSGDPENAMHWKDETTPLGEHEHYTFRAKDGEIGRAHV